MRSVHPQAGVLVYERQGGPITAVLAPNVVPEGRLGRLEEPMLFVVYSADHAKLISGYQTVGHRALDLPEGFQWLR